MYELYGAIVGGVLGLLVGAGVSHWRDSRILEKALIGLVLGAILGVVAVAVGQGAVK